jgi:hypothetical protein
MLPGVDNLLLKSDGHLLLAARSVRKRQLSTV